jgi:Fic family protein
LAYYQLLNAVNNKNNWEEYILYILKAIEETSTDTINKINDINNLLDETLLKVKNKANKIYRKELVELLFEEPYSKIENVVNRLGVERKAASRYLKVLERIGVLTAQKIGRETLYLNIELIKILK